MEEVLISGHHMAPIISVEFFCCTCYIATKGMVMVPLRGLSD
jgi:hypothetical protein